MRILLASETYAPSVNGAAVFTGRLGAGVASRGHAVAVVAPSPTGQPCVGGDAKGVTIYRVRSMPTSYPGQRCALPVPGSAGAILTAFCPDVLHVQNHFVLGYTLARAARRRRIPVVGTNHFMPENMLPHAPGILRWRPVHRLIHRTLWRQLVRLYDGLDAVTAPSRAAVALMRAHGLEGPVRVISNGIDVDRFHPPRAPRELPGSGQRAATPMVLYVGRLDPDKGVDTLIRAMAQVVERRPAFLTLAGRGTHESALRRLAETLGIAARVHFAGFVSDAALPELLRSASVFVMPSANELQSIATLEAMASGLPVAAADALALPELVEDGKNGFLFSDGDAMSLAERIVRLLDDSVVARRLGRASRETAEHHSMDLTLNAFETLYRDLFLVPTPTSLHAVSG